VNNILAIAIVKVWEMLGALVYLQKVAIRTFPFYFFQLGFQYVLYANHQYLLIFFCKQAWVVD
jgi:hypothetical protein